MLQPKQQITLPKEWKDFLADVDQALGQKFELRCVGGFVLAALYALPRPTADVDYVEITPLESEADLTNIAGESSKLAKKHKLFIHRTTIAEYPYEFESRLQKLELGLQRLEMSVLGPYDLVLSKLCSDRTKDEEDAKYLIRKVGLNWEELLRIWESEMKSQVAPRHATSIRLAREYFPT
jgi:hypothetical protein